jgi:cytidylate kinase
MLIAIDGPAASGKGTLARRIAEHLGFSWLDTGLLYRALARDVLARGFRLDDRWAALALARSLDPSTFGDPALRGPQAGDRASVVARLPEVRTALLNYQRAFAAAKPGAVLDGRDIGTVVCPEADVKIYVTASAEERARRRALEHQRAGDAVDYETILADIRARDVRDSERSVAPLRPAADAVVLDTTNLDVDGALAAALDIIQKRQVRARAE